ncbi:hypothetical protein UFOVP32_31 [uncultured Caudovirales phage]|uniref:Uncharacterized protein n=1 Tax=uncultured Caudovirales phage TaxID=2100421 RepID=A0A6J5KPA9_9CAUD|nr:hypothetical protein UFOVP32_31 [uncultured Caudovirales phage]CAB4123701.1 hypothetical protein UFOVP50_45 [uncultured Caudovirales phage]
MTLLMKTHILKASKRHPHLRGADLAWDEPGKCIITLRDGITWDARDGNRHVEGFVFANDSMDNRDTLAHFADRLKWIEPEA